MSIKALAPRAVELFDASKIYDVAIIGAGIVGLAIARELSIRHPKLRMCVLERRNDVAQEQSSQNSGVVHSGIYYKRNSLKSRYCISGSEMAIKYCEKKGIPIAKCGKLVLASTRSASQQTTSDKSTQELEILHDLYKNSREAGIKDISLVTRNQINKIQPDSVDSVEGLWSPNTSIVDWNQVARSYGKDFLDNQGDIFTRFCAIHSNPCTDMKTIQINDVLGRTIQTRCVAICAGVATSYLAVSFGMNNNPKILSFKGKYYTLDSRIASKIKTNLYPIPNPNLPFLGVHITPRLDGSVIVGPTAMITSPLPGIFSKIDTFLSKPFRNMIRRKDYFKAGVDEILKSISKEYLVREVQKLLPGVKSFDLKDEGFFGVRAQAVSDQGQLIDDFIIETSQDTFSKNTVLVRNCPSPAATSSLAIAMKVSDLIENRFL